MEVEIKREGRTLRGLLEGTATLHNDHVAILMHGFMGDRGNYQGKLLYDLSHALNDAGIPTLRFDFAGCGESDGNFAEMTVLSELLDGMAIIDYARTTLGAKKIDLVGHSQGGVVASMLAGYYGPTLIVHGEDDQVVSPEAARKYNVIFPQSKLYLMPGEGHLLEGPKLAEILQTVTTFLQDKE